MYNKQIFVFGIILFLVCVSTPIHVSAASDPEAHWIEDIDDYFSDIEEVTYQVDKQFNIGVLFLNPAEEPYSVFEVRLANSETPDTKPVIVQEVYYQLSNNFYVVPFYGKIPELGTWILTVEIHGIYVEGEPQLPFIRDVLTVHIVEELPTTTTTTTSITTTTTIPTSSTITYQPPVKWQPGIMEYMVISIIVMSFVVIAIVFKKFPVESAE